ncbi:hypothetical protein JL193_13335 [Polaribacter batillariae]|uniref:Uncharacterized protein n=1 Tax=Polaribacter batillariae TaxID=2808900 RepID=A0ABX7ST73_9FLAO|nr:hypothetical protein [Polaribacter batillariae]QTD37092.1 hypothetical protein JL193_13335 [Polaribacter batillariae]
MANKNQQSFSNENFSQLEIDVFDHINTIKTDAKFNLIIDYFSIPPELQNYYVYFSLFHKIKHQKSISFINFIEDALFKINKLLTRFENELLLAKFHSISKIEHDNWVMNNVFKNLKIIQNTYDIEKYPLTELKLLKLQNQLLNEKISILEKKINKEINLKTHVIDIVYNSLKLYFIEEQHQQLYNVLKGKSFENKLCFLKNQSQLAELFRRLKYNDKLDSNYSEIKEWLCANFTYSNSIKPLNSDSVYEVLTAKGNKDITKSKRLLILEFPYKKPNQVKKEKEN